MSSQASAMVVLTLGNRFGKKETKKNGGLISSLIPTSSF
jgi:hypothetical protein